MAAKFDVGVSFVVVPLLIAAGAGVDSLIRRRVGAPVRRRKGLLRRIKRREVHQEGLLRAPQVVKSGNHEALKMLVEHQGLGQDAPGNSHSHVSLEPKVPRVVCTH